MRAFTRYDENSKKYELVIDNSVFRKTAGGEVFLLTNIEKYKNFAALNVDVIHLMNGTEYKFGNTPDGAIKMKNDKAVPILEFDVNSRYKFMEKFVRMTVTKQTESTILVGQGGLGKTYTVLKTVDDLGLKEDDEYIIIKGYSTAKGLYRTLYENRKRIIIFDDCDSILKDNVARNILKGALDSYETRRITWNAEMSKNDDLPKSFIFKGSIVFISNLMLSKFDQALISRSMVVDLSMTRTDIINRMETVLKDIMPSVSMDVKEKALNFIKENIAHVGDLNFRTLMKVIKIANTFDDYEEMALYTITN